MQTDNDNLHLIGFLIGILVVGIFCGLAPLITGIVKKRISLGVIGFISCLIGSGILGIILALPVAVIFTLVIALKENSTKTFQNPPEPPVFDK